MRPSGLLDGLFPAVCAFCGAVIGGGDVPICADCLRSLPYRRDFFDMPSTKTDAFRHASGVFCPLFYRDQTVRVVSAMKFEDRRDISAAFGYLIAVMIKRAVPAKFLPSMAVVPVPLHRDRERRRGYNQSADIAEAVSRFTGIEVDANAMLRSRNSSPQHTRDRLARLTNDPGYLAARSVAGKGIILVDDVMTTGATMEKCAAALLERGAAAVYYAAGAGNFEM